MEVVLNYSNNCYRLTMVDKNRKRSTNSYKRIRKFVSSLPEPIGMEITSNLKLKYSNGDCLILKNYKKILEKERKQRFGIYSSILSKVRKDIPKTKANYINYKKIAKIIIVASAVLTIAGTIITTSNNEDIDISVDDSNEIISSVEIEQVSPLPIVVDDNYEDSYNNYADNQDDNYVNNQDNNYDDNYVNNQDNNYDENNEEQSIETISVSDEDFDIIHRIEQTQNIYCGNIINNRIFPICSTMDSYATQKIVNFLNSTNGQAFIKYGEEFGVDPYILIAVSLTESSLKHYDCIPGGSSYNGSAVGIMQLENPNNGRIITAYNYTTGCEETIKMSMNKACDFDTNVKAGTMIIQNYMHKYNNNIYLVLQAYNYGSPTMDMLINLYAEETNQTYEDVINNYNDTGWMKYVKDLCNNPRKYYSNWGYKNYGNDKYVSKVLGYYLGVQSKNILEDGTICYTNLLTMEKVYEDQNAKQF